MSKWHGIMTVVAALLVLAAPVLAVDIEVPADIGGVSTNAVALAMSTISAAAISPSVRPTSVTAFQAPTQPSRTSTPCHTPAVAVHLTSVEFTLAVVMPPAYLSPHEAALTYQTF